MSTQDLLAIDIFFNYFEQQILESTEVLREEEIEGLAESEMLS